MVYYNMKTRDLLNDMFGQLNSYYADNSNLYASERPRFTLEDKGDCFEGSYPVPGARREDLKITVKENKLSVSYAPEKKNHYTANFSFVWDAKGFDTDNIKAAFVDGVLTLTVPKQKKPEPQVKTIQVN